MPRIIDQIRASKLPSNMMQFAARGALSVPPAENIEILVYLAKCNKVFGDVARMTLAEKLGQLTMTASSYAVTGPVIAGDSTQAIKDGTIGNLLNMVGADHVREVACGAPVAVGA